MFGVHRFRPVACFSVVARVLPVYFAVVVPGNLVVVVEDTRAAGAASRDTCPVWFHVVFPDDAYVVVD